MKFVLMFEWSAPFRWKPKLETIGVQYRFIWTMFSVAVYRGVNMNDLFNAFEKYGEEKQKGEIK